MAQARRHDPKTRSLAHMSGDDKDPNEVVRNKDPLRHYVMVSTSGDDVDHYLDDGYVVELHRPDGPQFAGGYKPNQAESEMRKYGCVLMSIDKQKKHEIDQYGRSGNAGYESIRRKQAQVTGRAGLENPVKNINPRYVGFQNESSPEMGGFGSEG